MKFSSLSGLFLYYISPRVTEECLKYGNSKLGKASFTEETAITCCAIASKDSERIHSLYFPQVKILKNHNMSLILKK
jgi:hypothetical protein